MRPGGEMERTPGRWRELQAGVRPGGEMERTPGRSEARGRDGENSRQE